MGRRYAFELFYPAERMPAALDAVSRTLTPIGRERTREPAKVRPWNLSGLTPHAPVFMETSLLFPADDEVRAYCLLGDVGSEWTEDGVECLLVGFIDLVVRLGLHYALLSITARTSRMSDLFRDSLAVWAKFAGLLRASGGLVGLFQGGDRRGIARYPLLPDGQEAAEQDFFDFVLEERDMYWHIDTDRYATAVLLAPRVLGSTRRCT
jgi:hypothetical protein